MSDFYGLFFSSARDRSMADSSGNEAVVMLVIFMVKYLIIVTTTPLCVTASHVFVCYQNGHTAERPLQCKQQLQYVCDFPRYCAMCSKLFLTVLFLYSVWLLSYRAVFASYKCMRLNTRLIGPVSNLYLHLCYDQRITALYFPKVGRKKSNVISQKLPDGHYRRQIFVDRVSSAYVCDSCCWECNIWHVLRGCISYICCPHLDWAK